MIWWIAGYYMGLIITLGFITSLLDRCRPVSGLAVVMVAAAWPIFWPYWLGGRLARRAGLPQPALSDQSTEEVR